MSRPILAIALSVGLSAAPAANAAMLVCRSDAPQACCCPEPSASIPCELSCVPDAPAAAVIASPVSVRLAAAGGLELGPAPGTLQTALDLTGPQQPVSYTLHAPPRRRYLQACVLRL